MRITDNEVNAALLKAAFDARKAWHEPARRILCRDHFRLLWQYNPADTEVNPDAGRLIYEAARRKYHAENVRYDRLPPKGGAPDFPVLMRDGRIESSLAVSDVLRVLPVAKVENVFIIGSKLDEARRWLRDNREKIIVPRGEKR
jgi:hypothetical protein